MVTIENKQTSTKATATQTVSMNKPYQVDNDDNDSDVKKSPLRKEYFTFYPSESLLSSVSAFV